VLDASKGDMRRQPWPERAGEAQCLGGCLGKAGRLRFEPDIFPLRARIAGVNQQYLPGGEVTRGYERPNALEADRFLPNVAELLQHR
jgi:hypothetical protein